MKLKFLIFHFSFLILTACGASKPVTTTHTERIEEKVMPIPVGADTIEITLCRDTRSECPDGTRSVNQRSLSLWRKNSVSSVGSVRDKKPPTLCIRTLEPSVPTDNHTHIVPEYASL